MSRPSISELVHGDISAAEQTLQFADEMAPRYDADGVARIEAAVSRLSVRLEALTRATIAQATALASIAQSLEDR